jgi:hypothetical protein
VDADLLAHELRRRGLVILGVAGNQVLREVLIVFLHGAAGQWVKGEALRIVRTVPGVLVVQESQQSPLILLVRVETTVPLARVDSRC